MSSSSVSATANLTLVHSPTPVMAAITPPTKQSLLHLYHSMLRTSQSFSSYNFRNYFVRRTKSTFREIQVCRRCWTCHSNVAITRSCIGRNRFYETHCLL